MQLSAEEKLMYRVMKSIYESGIPISFKGSLVMKACLMAEQVGIDYIQVTGMRWFKERIKNILDYIRGGKSIYQNLVFVFEGEGGERIINESLIEDNFCKWFPMDYSSFYKKYIKGNSSFGY